MIGARSVVPLFQGLLRALGRLPARVLDRRFWFIQAMVLGVVALHVYTEAGGYEEPFGSFHHIPVTLYLIPVSYASFHFRLEGGVLTGVWAALLTIPNMVFWHTSGLMWLGEIAQLVVVVMVGSILSWRVEREARERWRADEASVRLQVSEEKYRNLFEAAGDAILVFGPLGEFLAANAAASRLTHYTLEELPGIGAEQLLDTAGWRALREASETVPAAPLRLLLTTKAGTQITVEASCALVKSQDEPLVQAVLRDVTEQQRQQQNLRSYARLVMRAQEEERRRIAREIHDEPVQEMVILCRDLATLLESRDLLPEPFRRGLTDVRDRSEKTLGIMRRFSRELRPSILDDLGLIAAIKGLTVDLLQRLGLEGRLEVSGSVRRLAPDVELGLFRIVQEALRNVEKYASARCVNVTVHFDDGRVSVTIADNGKGFEVPSRLGDLTAEGKLGVVGMEERAHLLGGSLEVWSSAGGGTQVSVQIPA